jgi:hypothetical protein
MTDKKNNNIINLVKSEECVTELEDINLTNEVLDLVDDYINFHIENGKPVYIEEICASLEFVKTNVILNAMNELDD